MDSILVATRAACLHISKSTITAQANGIVGREGRREGRGEGSLQCNLKKPVVDLLHAASVRKALPLPFVGGTVSTLSNNAFSKQAKNVEEYTPYDFYFMAVVCLVRYIYIYYHICNTTFMHLMLLCLCWQELM